MNTSWRAAVFKFKSPGAGSVALSTCGYTTQNTVWEVYSSTDGTLRSSTAKHVAGKDEGCDVPGPTEGSVSGIKQGVTYFFLVRLRSPQLLLGFAGWMYQLLCRQNSQASH